MADYNVKLVLPEGVVQELVCPENDIILDAAEEADIDLPYSCRAGSCSTCLGQLIEGKVDQSEQSFLSDEDISQGYVLTCIAYPLSNCEIHTHKEDDYDN